MLDFQQIKDQYPPHLQGYERAILREYLQYKILQAIFNSNSASKLSFLGGTALRVVYGNLRFSEDIDLDNFGLSWQAFGGLILKLKRFLELEGFEVEISQVEKSAYHCFLRFPELLFEQELPTIKQEKILIRVDTVAQGYHYQPEIKILNKFDVFTEIRVTPPALLLSQKIYTAVNRKRPKGRDFYDITFLFGMTKPDFGFIKQKMGLGNPEELREVFLKRIVAINFDALAQDIAPFLINQDQIKRVLRFREFWKGAEMV